MWYCMSVHKMWTKSTREGKPTKPEGEITMARTWYGNLNNRLEENRQFCDEIKVGSGMTEYLYSDRHAYEVVAVKDQKHVTVRMLDAKHVGEAFENKWELTSNKNNPTMEMAKRGNRWYRVSTVTADFLDGCREGTDDYVEKMLWLCHNGISVQQLKEKGKITKYHVMNVSFGKADYYYDYEF